MIYQLRNSNRNTICDVELYNSGEDRVYYLELHASVFIKGFIDVYNQHPSEDTVFDFEQVEDLRCWLWEDYFMKIKNDGSDENYNNVNNHVKDILSRLATKYDVYLYED